MLPDLLESKLETAYGSLPLNNPLNLYLFKQEYSLV